MKALYTAVATATERGRNGRTRTSDGKLDLELSMPEAMGGPGGEGTNPEQLFAAGYASCFHSALKLVAEHRKIDHAGSSVTARVGFGPTGSGGFGLEVALDVQLPGVDAEAAEKVVRRAQDSAPHPPAGADVPPPSHEVTAR